MELMKGYPDGYFDLAVVDPPYGLGFGKFNRVSKASNGERYISNNYVKGDWDKAVPDESYFKELMRVSKDQIIWGGNYFPLGPTQCFIFWYKKNPVPNFADGELAWTSFKKPAVCFDYRYYGNLEGNTSATEKIHPTQKPVKLYQFVFEKFATPDMKVLDTHLGGGSSAIAAHYFGCKEFVGSEINKQYYDAAMKRFSESTMQMQIF